MKRVTMLRLFAFIKIFTEVYISTLTFLYLHIYYKKMKNIG